MLILFKKDQYTVHVLIFLCYFCFYWFEWSRSNENWHPPPTIYLANELLEASSIVKISNFLISLFTTSIIQCTHNIILVFVTINKASAIHVLVNITHQLLNWHFYHNSFFFTFIISKHLSAFLQYLPLNFSWLIGWCLPHLSWPQ